MIRIDLIEALRKQMRFCETEYKYRCGVYVTSKVKRDIVVQVISNIIPQINKDDIRIVNRSYESCVEYKNGSCIQVLSPSEMNRGCRFNGVIVEDEISNERISQIILPCLMSLRLETGSFSHDDNPRLREYYCHIGSDDVIKSERQKSLLYVLSSSYSDRKHGDNLDSMLEFIRFIQNREVNNSIKFEKEYMCMWNENNYNTPIRTTEKDNCKILVFNALGIPKERISYRTEFVNKSKELYLLVKGEVDFDEYDYKNGINIREKINTDIYDGYEITIGDGLIVIKLHEILNEKPVLVDYGENK